jgi:hypothetical protein
MKNTLINIGTNILLPVSELQKTLHELGQGKMGGNKSDKQRVTMISVPALTG